ncbi:diguanylate cyclase (GGDEF)-like protein [Pseudoduganella flava]|uniref:diguanylate cyclase n=1 Tax=Pseudoduganella flava TaxID=871742 RepID=A0A562PDL2_9BURK|nr:GGDEF domain-containing protein [Pseudoduganella flava]QGZ42192.1 diguanylate cyclase [Pseudoduganella flava]TWI42423.1 diguanylate cyclase (GGDEF)-like protein [Pseudoduganella flava]
MDVKTLVLTLALGNLALTAALFFQDIDNRHRGRFATFTLARQVQACAWLLLYFRGVIPELLAGPVANVALFAGIALDAGALWERAGRPGWRRILLPALGLASAAFVACYVLDIDPALRVAAGSAIAGAFLLAGAAALAVGWREASMLRRFLAVATAVLALAIAGRGLLTWALPQGWPGVGPAQLQGLGYAAFYLAMLFAAGGYLLLERESLRQQLARLEVVDPLTDVPNRRGFYQALAPWLALARRPGQPTALVILNLDQFKRVNDHYGHAVGDKVLKAMVDACRRQLRDSDQMGRLGGAEFALLLPRTTLADAVNVAERIRAALEALPVKAERAVINLTASLGVTTIRADDSTVSLFKRADEALQAAKLRGRNQVVAAPPPAAEGTGTDS